MLFLVLLIYVLIHQQFRTTQPTWVASGTIVFTAPNRVDIVSITEQLASGPTFSGISTPGTCAPQWKYNRYNLFNTGSEADGSINAVPNAPTAPTVSSTTTQPLVSRIQNYSFTAALSWVEYSINNGTASESLLLQGLAPGTHTYGKIQQIQLFNTSGDLQ
jgi:hypothetical protein